jgi:hypothetical protein
MGSYDGPVVVTLDDGTRFEAEASLHDLGWDDDRVASVAWLGTLTTEAVDLADRVGDLLALGLVGGGTPAQAVIGRIRLQHNGYQAIDLLGVGPAPFGP